jgi:hypothetical protein
VMPTIMMPAAIPSTSSRNRRLDRTIERIIYALPWSVAVLARLVGNP